MFWKWYYQSFSVRVKIIAYNAIIIFWHLIEVAIFAVGDFFSLFGIAVFNIPITHKIVVLLFLLQSYCFFRYFQTFFDFFHYCRLDLPLIANFVLPVFRPFPAVSSRPLVSCVPVALCSGGAVSSRVSCFPQSYTHIHTRIHTHAHGNF